MKSILVTFNSNIAIVTYGQASESLIYFSVYSRELPDIRILLTYISPRSGVGKL